MARKLQADEWLFAGVVALALFGVIMVYSASAVVAASENHTQYHYVARQASWTLVGLGAMLLGMRLDYRQLRAPAVCYGLLGLTFVLLVAVFAFPPINGARRWIRFAGFSMQPSELAKLALVIFLARFLERRAGTEGSFLVTFLDPWADPQGAGYQVVQSLLAVGSGGVHGLGFTEGRQKMFFLPFAYSDFIFAVVSEELGLFGGLGVVALFGLFLWRGVGAGRAGTSTRASPSRKRC